MAPSKIPQKFTDKDEQKITKKIHEKKPVEIIREKNPDRFIPTGKELAKMLRDREK